jgi:addiction module RelE/StbE family toxin
MRIRWTASAQRDLDSISEYLATQSSLHTARRIALDLFDGVTPLEHFPEAGRIGRRQGTRELVFAGLPYIAVYRVRRSVVEILRILHGAQRWP